MRMTFAYKNNKRKISAHTAKVVNEMAMTMNPTDHAKATMCNLWNAVPYNPQHRQNDHGHQPGQFGRQQLCQ
jgi:gluconate 2-dehydrogenase alpha chain